MSIEIDIGMFNSLQKQWMRMLYAVCGFTHAFLQNKAIYLQHMYRSTTETFTATQYSLGVSDIMRVRCATETNASSALAMCMVRFAVNGSVGWLITRGQLLEGGKRWASHTALSTMSAIAPSTGMCPRGMK
jgi:hypothetical protein